MRLFEYLFIHASSHKAISFNLLLLKVLLILFSTFMLQVAICFNWLMLSRFEIELFSMYLFRSSPSLEGEEECIEARNLLSKINLYFT